VGLRRVAVAIALTCAAAGAPYQVFEDGALGLCCELPAGHQIERLGPAAGVATNVARITWAEGDYAGAETVISALAAGEGLYLMALGNARARGEAADYQLAVIPFARGDLEKFGADDGFAITYLEGTPLAGEERRHDVLFFAAGPRRITMDFSYPNAAADHFKEITAHVIDTIVIRTAEKAGPPAGEPPAAKE
jgi:hypothetical protein